MLVEFPFRTDVSDEWTWWRDRSVYARRLTTHHAIPPYYLAVVQKLQLPDGSEAFAVVWWPPKLIGLLVNREIHGFVARDVFMEFTNALVNSWAPLHPQYGSWAMPALLESGVRPAHQDAYEEWELSTPRGSARFFVEWCVESPGDPEPLQWSNEVELGGPCDILEDAWVAHGVYGEPKHWLAGKRPLYLSGILNLLYKGVGATTAFSFRSDGITVIHTNTLDWENHSVGLDPALLVDMVLPNRKDELTGVLNRRGWLDLVTDLVFDDIQDKHHVLMLGIRRFKAVNDIAGHDAGDHILKEVADRLRRHFRTDHIARWQGDEFLVLLDDDTASSVLAVLDEPYFSGSEQYRLHFCTTTRLWQMSAMTSRGDIAEAMQEMEMLFRTEKERTGVRSKVQVASTNGHDKWHIETDLHTALEDGTLRLEYQPIQHIHTGRWEGVEALARWRHPKYGLVAPDLFIPIAEETGVIGKITEVLLRQACTDLQGLEDALGYPLRMALNVSAIHFAQPDFLHVIPTVLEDMQMSPDKLRFELTESTLLQSSDLNRSRMRELQDYGIAFSIDDFGTGYASLSYLKNFTFNQVKIDKMFLIGSETQAHQKFLGSLIRMLHDLDVETLMEGVETVEHLDLLRSVGCLTGQGYYFGRPATLAELVAGLKTK